MSVLVKAGLMLLTSTLVIIALLSLMVVFILVYESLQERLRRKGLVENRDASTIVPDKRRGV